jgi:hypothetical protein
VFAAAEPAGVVDVPELVLEEPPITGVVVVPVELPVDVVVVPPLPRASPVVLVPAEVLVGLVDVVAALVDPPVLVPEPSPVAPPDPDP